MDFCSPKIKPLIRIGIQPYRWMAASALKRATGIIGTSEKFLEWGLNYAGREETEKDRVYYVSYPDSNISIENDDIQFWRRQGIGDDDFVCCFFGQFGFSVDLEMIMRGAVIAASKAPNLKFVICGVGEKLKDYQSIIKKVDNVIFPGWVNRKQISSLGRISSVGLLAYRPSKNFEYSMPNKFCEYLALGQVLMMEPKGMMLDYAVKNNCGLHYSDENELIDSLIELSADKERVEKMKTNSRKLYEEKFCAEKVYSEYACFLEEQADLNFQ